MNRNGHHLVGIVSMVVPVLGIATMVGQGTCPPVLAELLPKNAAHVNGQYNSAGMIGLGYAAADLPFDHPCTTSTKYPGHITFDIKRYQGDGLKLFRMQIDSEEQQRLQNKREEFAKSRTKLQAPNANVVLVNPVRTETVSGGTILYFDYYTDCSEGTKRSKPSVQLLAVAHTEGAAINIEIDGFMSAEAAKAAASTVLGNFAKAELSRLGK